MGWRIEIVCDCAEELKLQSPSCCLRPRQIYYHTRQQKTQTYGSIVCVCMHRGGMQRQAKNQTK